jgi:hypothetical protein
MTDEPYQPTDDQVREAENFERAALHEREMRDLCLAPEGQQRHADNAGRLLRTACWLRTGKP